MNNNNAGAGAAIGMGIIGLFFILLYLAIIVGIIAGFWKVYSKAGKPGWASIIPIYSQIVLLEIIGKPLWWIILFIIPCTAPVVYIMAMLELSKKFGQSAGYAIGMILLPFVFLPMLGFGSAQYNPNA